MSFYSLDREDGIEAAAVACHSDNPEYIFTMMERHCNLCQALNSLPESQGKRIEAHYLQGKSRKAARRLGKSKQFIRIALQNGVAPFGFATKGSGDAYDYHISPKLLNEYIGEHEMHGNEYEEHIS